MKKLFIGIFFSASFLANASDIELGQGQSLKIKIFGCESYEQEVITVNKNFITGKCIPSTCRSIYDRKSKMYNVYRYENGECSRTACNNAELVGQYRSSVTPGSWERVKKIFDLKPYIRADLEDFITSHDRCGVINYYIHDATESIVVKRLLK